MGFPTLRYDARASATPQIGDSRSATACMTQPRVIGPTARRPMPVVARERRGCTPALAVRDQNALGGHATPLHNLWVPNWPSTAVTCGISVQWSWGHDRRSWRYDCCI